MGDHGTVAVISVEDLIADRMGQFAPKEMLSRTRELEPYLKLGMLKTWCGDDRISILFRPISAAQRSNPSSQQRTFRWPAFDHKWPLHAIGSR